MLIEGVNDVTTYHSINILTKIFELLFIIQIFFDKRIHFKYSMKF